MEINIRVKKRYENISFFILSISLFHLSKSSEEVKFPLAAPIRLIREHSSLIKKKSNGSSVKNHFFRLDSAAASCYIYAR